MPITLPLGALRSGGRRSRGVARLAASRGRLRKIKRGTEGDIIKSRTAKRFDWPILLGFMSFWI